jgi:hypothetical protein
MAMGGHLAESIYRRYAIADESMLKAGRERFTSAVGSAWEREPWTAVQRVVWETLRRSA